MSDSLLIQNGDDDSLTDGDTPLEDIDWSKVEYLEERYIEIYCMPDGEEKSLAMAVLLHEMHGDKLEVL